MNRAYFQFRRQSMRRDLTQRRRVRRENQLRNSRENFSAFIFSASSASSASLRSNSAFTLIEVMLSLFIALLLLLGLNTIFKASSQTIEAGNSLSAAVRNGRAVTP